MKRLLGFAPRLATDTEPPPTVASRFAGATVRCAAAVDSACLTDNAVPFGLHTHLVTVWRSSAHVRMTLRCLPAWVGLVAGLPTHVHEPPMGRHAALHGMRVLPGVFAFTHNKKRVVASKDMSKLLQTGHVLIVGIDGPAGTVQRVSERYVAHAARVQYCVYVVSGHRN